MLGRCSTESCGSCPTGEAELKQRLLGFRARRGLGLLQGKTIGGLLGLRGLCGLGCSGQEGCGSKGLGIIGFRGLGFSFCRGFKNQNRVLRAEGLGLRPGSLGVRGLGFGVGAGSPGSER